MAERTSGPIRKTDLKPSKESKSKKIPLTVSIPFIISVVVHGSLLMIVGGIVIFPGTMNDSSFVSDFLEGGGAAEEPVELLMEEPMESAMAEELMEEPTLDDSTSVVSELNEPASMVNVITVNEATSGFRMPASAAAVGVPSTLKAGGMSQTLSKKLSRSVGGAGMGGAGSASALIGGLTVQSNNLGVVLDTSLSDMWSFRPIVVKMIQDNFSEALIEQQEKGHFHLNFDDRLDTQAEAIVRLLERGKARGKPLDTIYMLFDAGEQGGGSQPESVHEQVRTKLAENNTRLLVQLAGADKDRLHKHLRETVQVSGGEIVEIRLDSHEKDIVEAQRKSFKTRKEKPSPYEVSDEIKRFIWEAEQDRKNRGIK